MNNMKDSGIRWIGNIPQEWTLKRIKYSLKCKITDGPHETPEFIDEGIPFLSVDSIQNNQLIIDNVRYISEADALRFDKKCKPQKGDILMGKAASIGKIAIVENDKYFQIWSPLALIRCNNKKLLNRFLKYYLESSCGQEFIESLSTKNTQKNIAMEDIEKIKIVIPNIEEQKLIANFLDNKVGKTDVILNDLNKQINILKDYKKSLITETVIKGVNYNLEKKKSGIEWIGMIPIHWKISKLKYVSNFVNGDRGSNYPSGNDMVDDGVIFVTSNNIHETILNNSPENCKFITEERYKKLGGAKIDINDIIFCLRGSVGMCAINKTESKGTVASSLVDIKPKRINPDFLNYFLQSELSKYQTNLYTNGSCAANLSAENVANYYFIEPPMQEQHEIAKYLDSKCTKIDELIKDKQIQIKKMEKYKKSLIYEYVTGKKRVKGAEELYG